MKKEKRTIFSFPPECKKEFLEALNMELDSEELVHHPNGELARGPDGMPISLEAVTE